MSQDRGSVRVDDERDGLLFFLNRLRDSVVRTSHGLSDDTLRAPGVPSGTNVLGLIQHLTAMEVQWFRGVFLGEDCAVDGSMWVPESVGADDVVAAYRQACADSDRIVRACPDLSTKSARDASVPASTARRAEPSEVRPVSLRRVVTHMIEETARHAGHADILRERIDGATDL